MGVANYGQMTAGGWMYIGPQGIVHGTFNTILNAGRKYLGVPEQGDLTGHTFVSSGLGGMSGAQPKAANIARAVGIFAEVDISRIKTRHDQGWVDVVMDDIDEIFALASKKLAAQRKHFHMLTTATSSTCWKRRWKRISISICCRIRLRATMYITAVTARPEGPLRKGPVCSTRTGSFSTRRLTRPCAATTGPQALTERGT